MLFSIQFPIADLRKFVCPGSLIRRPGWPNPDLDTEFVRYFGTIRKRGQGGLEDWVGESRLCEADRALRFRETCAYRPINPAKRVSLVCAYRRFYKDDLGIGRYDVGLAHSGMRSAKLTPQDMEPLLRHLLGLKVVVREPNETPNATKSSKEGTLLEAGNRIARLYAFGSTKQTHRGQSPQWWVLGGAPMLTLSLPAPAKFELKTTYSTEPEGGQGLRVMHSYIRFKGREVSLWTFEGINGDNTEKARQLRLYLTRVHTEQECLRLTINQIQSGNIVVSPRSPEAQALQRYLKLVKSHVGKAETRLEKDFDPEIADIAREAIYRSDPGLFANLKAKLESMEFRPYVVGMMEDIGGKVAQINYYEAGSQGGQNTVTLETGDTYNSGGGPIAVANDEATQTGFVMQGAGSMTAADLKDLIPHLTALRTQVKQEQRALEDKGEDAPEHEKAVVALREAEAAASQGNQEGVLETLKSGGKWLLDFATKVGSSVVTKMIEKQIGIG